MTEELLTKIKQEAKKEIGLLKEYNEYARLRNQLAEQEVIKKGLGLLYRNDLWMPEKTEDGIIMSIYQKHIGEIEENDTNEIYYYDGTYKYIYDNLFKYDVVEPLEELVDRNDPEANFRRYSNIEGVYSYDFCLEDADEFERTHTVLYDEETITKGMQPYWFTEDFVLTAVKENQKVAVNHILKKYLKKREK